MTRTEFHQARGALATAAADANFARITCLGVLGLAEKSTKVGSILMKKILAVTAIGGILVGGGLEYLRSQTAQSLRTQQFENEDVKVWKTVVLPNAPLVMHRHEHPRVIIPLSGGTMKIVEQDGNAAVHNWETGKAYWLPSSPPNTMHSDVNAGDQPIEVMVVELEKEK
jgi:hypothetical protein